MSIGEIIERYQNNQLEKITSPTHSVEDVQLTKNYE